MKKTLITLAVAAASVAAQADMMAKHADTTVLYGQVGYQAFFDFGNVSEKGVKIGEKIKNGLEQSSITATNIGVKGTEDLGNGITALFDYNFGVDLTGGINSTNNALLGFQGEFGKVTLGKQDGVFGDYTGQANYFNSSKKVFGGWKSGGYDFSAGVRYDAPAFVEGVKASLSYDLTQKLVEAGVGFDAYGLNIGVAGQYKHVGEKDPGYAKDQNNYRAGASVGYSNDMFKAGLDYTFTPPATGRDDLVKKSTHEVGLGLGYNVTDASTLYAGAQIDANVAEKGTNPNKNFQVGLGYEYNISKRTKAWFETGLDHHGKTSDKADDAQNNFKATVGIRHKF